MTNKFILCRASIEW